MHLLILISQFLKPPTFVYVFAIVLKAYSNTRMHKQNREVNRILPAALLLVFASTIYVCKKKKTGGEKKLSHETTDLN